VPIAWPTGLIRSWGDFTSPAACRDLCCACGDVVQVGLISRCRRASLQQALASVRLAISFGGTGLALRCEPRRVGRDMSVGLLLVRQRQSSGGTYRNGNKMSASDTMTDSQMSRRRMLRGTLVAVLGAATSGIPLSAQQLQTHRAPGVAPKSKGALVFLTTTRKSSTTRIHKHYGRPIRPN
jgi:hypothetical protein